MKQNYLPAFKFWSSLDKSPKYATHIDVKSIGGERSVTIHLKAYQFKIDSLTMEGKPFQITLLENTGKEFESITYYFQPTMLREIPVIEAYNTPDNIAVIVDKTINTKNESGELIYGIPNTILEGFVTNVNVVDFDSKTGFSNIPFHSLITNFKKNYFNEKKLEKEFSKEKGFVSLVKTN